MKTMTVGEFKTHFSQALKEVEAGEKIGITYGKAKKIRAYFVPKAEVLKARKLGIYKKKAKIIFKAGFKITEKEFLNL
jgi:hypothetical protein